MAIDFQSVAQALLSEVAPRSRLLEASSVAARPGSSGQFVRLRIDSEFAVREISIPASLADAVASGQPEACNDLRERLRSGLAARGNRVGETQAEC